MALIGANELKRKMLITIEKQPTVRCPRRLLRVAKRARRVDHGADKAPQSDHGRGDGKNFQN